VKFPGLIGPLNERLICKIKCIDGNWVGPLCSTTPTNHNFQKETSFPHGATIVSRCIHFGLYKLKGDGVMRCENGEWMPGFPECLSVTVTDTRAPLRMGRRTRSTLKLLYSAQEYCNMHFLYGECGGNASAAAALYRERYPNARHPDYRVFIRVHSCYLEGRIPGRGLGGTSEGRPQLIDAQDIVLNKVAEDSTISVRDIARREGIAKSTVHRILKRRKFHPYHVTRVQTLQPRDFAARGLTYASTARVLVSGTQHTSAASPDSISAASQCSRAWAMYNSSFGGRAVFQCSWGYRLVGAPGLECESDGRWSGEAPLCIR
ncbi:Hikaru genki, partial [Operophtera brumata]